MSYIITSPTFSFVRFGTTPEQIQSTCSDITADFYLPVLEEDDWAFQLRIDTNTAEEASILQSDPTLMVFRLENTNGDTVVDMHGNGLYASISRVGEKMLIAEWEHGFPGMLANVNIGKCFRLKVQIIEDVVVSNLFQRIGDDCYTTKFTYAASKNVYGFNYCEGGASGVEWEDSDNTDVLDREILIP